MTSYSNEGEFSLRKDSGMRIPSRMAAWMYVWVIALGLGVRTQAAAESQERRRGTELEQPCDSGLPDEPCTLGSPERRQLFEDIFEYTFRVRVGRGEHDFITLHRVVREVSAGVPLRTPRSVFLVHGDAWGFRGAFLASAASAVVPRQHSLAIYLAKRGVDVWGIDQRWVGVPQGTTDFSFMKDWNLGLHARDVGLGLTLARSARAYFSSEAGRMVLLGWSRGATVGYAYLNAESQLPPEKRHVSGFIPVDMAYTFAPGDTAERAAACLSYTAFAQAQDAGVYEGGQVGFLLQNLGGLALTAPDAASPIVAGLTNQQAGLLAGAATHALQNPPVIPGYHWTGGTFSALGLPTGLSWTRERFFFEGMTQSSPYQSIGEQVETFAMWCGAPDLPYDDHLGDVRVPVLYVGAAGGVGRYGFHSLTQLGSTDVTRLLVQRLPDAARALDYGHADLWLADDAPTTVWAPILDWVQRH